MNNMTDTKILIVDDDAVVRSSLTFLLKRAGYLPTAVGGPKEALQKVREEDFRLVLMDMNFTLTTTGEEGIHLLKQVKILRPDLPVILMTAWGSISLAVQGMQAGAFDFITKPWNNLVLLKAIRNALELYAPVGKEEATTQTQPCFDKIIGRSPALLSLLDTVARIAPTTASVLITGESGTGKELMAQSIHNASGRANGPFVAVNFAAITESLLDSELFGYVEGAFTGASRHGASGLFERANHGTIFLDEIGDAPLSFQVKLLRVLQEREIRRVGSAVPIHIDVRIIAATNQDLKELVRQGRFREDLYYRLSVLPLTLPPLVERKEDIPVLVSTFLQSFFLDMGVRETREWMEGILPILLQYSWPGNIRELQNVVEYLANVCDGNPRPEDLPHPCGIGRGNKLPVERH